EGCHAEVDLRRTTAPAVFSWLRRHGVSLDEMARTFNCGLGLILVVAPEQTDEALELLGEGALVGAIDEGERGVSVRGLEVFDG
ncbi:MAG: hypothetical protein KC609_13085, partial [Myxococcales bacterium]|nr:hypothetical protein [Myxococcales bacterium]